jgi:hypothetical protein
VKNQEEIPIVQEYLNVFPDELSGMPLDRAIFVQDWVAAWYDSHLEATVSNATKWIGGIEHPIARVAR